MKLEMKLELDIKITDGPLNINGIIKAVHLYQNKLGRTMVKEILEAIDCKACNEAVERSPLRYRNKGYSNRQFRYLMVDGTGARFQNRSDENKPEFYEGEIRFAFASVGEGKPDDIENLKDEDAETLGDLRSKTLHVFCNLHFFLKSKGYHNAAVYLSNLAKPFVTCIDQFLETDKMIPATSNIIEGKISLFKNRIKAIGKRWSEPGLMRWLAIAVRKLLPKFNWENLWDDITGNPLPVEIKLSLVSTKPGCH